MAENSIRWWHVHWKTFVCCG